MAYVIAEPCIDVLDISCVSVCPVDCIHYEEGVDRKLFIDPNECIDCGACEPECPVNAIFPEESLPAEWVKYARDRRDVVQRPRRRPDRRRRREATLTSPLRRAERARRRRATARYGGDEPARLDSTHEDRLARPVGDGDRLRPRPGRQLVGVTHECDYPAEAVGKPVITRRVVELRGASDATIHRRVAAAAGSGGPVFAVDEDGAPQGEAGPDHHPGPVRRLRPERSVGRGDRPRDRLRRSACSRSSRRASRGSSTRSRRSAP